MAKHTKKQMTARQQYCRFCLVKVTFAQTGERAAFNEDKSIHACKGEREYRAWREDYLAKRKEKESGS